MNLKKLLKQKIGFYDKRVYANIFYRIISDIANDKLKEKKQLFKIEDKSNCDSLWSKIGESIEKEDDMFGVPLIVYRYLLLKAREKYKEIVKFCSKEKYLIKDIMKIVTFYFFELVFR